MMHVKDGVLGFQKMSEITSVETQERMGRGADIQWESPFGTMMPAYYAMYANAHMAKYGTTLDDLATIRVKAAKYGQLNDKAVYRKPVTMDMFSDSSNIMSSPVSSPLRVGDCCANADGSSCIIVANKENTAIMILRRVAMAYEELPNWLKPGTAQFGKKEIILGNSSSIAISTTTGSAVRGDTVNCIIIDLALN